MHPLPLPARLAITWLAIFPLVSLAQWLLRPLLAGWPELLVTAAVVTVVVPIAVTVVVPTLTRLYTAATRRRSAEAGNQ